MCDRKILAISSEKKVLVIGLDGATLDLIGPLMNEGKLPNLAKMVSSGVQSKLLSTILPLSPTAWTSFSTGKNAGQHGIYDFSKRVVGTYEYDLTTSLDVTSRTLWDIIGAFGGRSIIINVPLTYPPRPLPGVMITGFPTPVAKNDYTYPATLLPALIDKFGEANIHKPPFMYKKGNEREITDKLIEITRKQTEITRYLMDSIYWNLTVSVYDATDVFGHYFWAYLDKNHPKYDAKLAGPVKNMVDEIHIELDTAIGKLMEAAGENSLKFVISDHGFGSVYYGVYVNNWLLEQKYMYFKNNLKVRAKNLAYRHGLHTYNLLMLAKKLGLVKSIESAYTSDSKSLKLLKMVSLSFEDIDWDRTKVFSFGNFGQLYLNLKGREPHGIVSQSEAPALVRELMEKLQKLEDPSTHKRMFDNVYSKLDVFAGDANKTAPDIVFFDEQMIYSAHRMFELGSNKLVTPHPVYSGNHKMDGLMFMSGKEVKPVGPLHESQPKLIDLAPTILHFMELGIPSDMDGRVLYELFTEYSEFAKRTVQYEVTTERSKIRSYVQKLRSIESL